MIFDSAKQNTNQGWVKKMKRFVPILILASVILGILSPISARVPANTDRQNVFGYNIANAQNPGSTGMDSKAYDNIINAMNGGGSSCSLLHPSSWVKECFLRPVGDFMLGLFSLYTAIGGLIFDGGMWCTVHMRDIMAGVPIVDTGWKIFRDLSNMFFIFILIYIAISTILGLGETKRMLVNVIVTALLINFSLFITKAVIDASNLLALQFYDRIYAAGATLSGSNRWNSGGISSLFMQGLQMQSVYQDPGLSAINGGSSEPMVQPMVGDTHNNVYTNSAKYLTMVFFSCIVMIIAGFIFAAGGILLMIRVVVLMFLMMISPLAFICRILPSLNSGWKKWSEALANNAIWAPSYLALTYVVAITAQAGFTHVAGLNATGGANSTATFSAAFSGAIASGMGLIINYILIIIMMIMTILISKQFGVYGAQAVVGWGENAARSARRWTTSRAKEFGGWGYRRTVGEGARQLEERARSSPGWQTRPGRFVRSFTTTAAAKAKMGGSMSAVDQYREDQKLREQHDIAVTRRDALTKIAEVTNKNSPDYLPDARERGRQIQDVMAHLTPKEIASMPKSELMRNKEILQYLSTAQVAAVIASGEYSESEKKEVLRGKLGRYFEPAQGMADVYEKAMQEYHDKKLAYEEWDAKNDPALPPPIDPATGKVFDPSTKEPEPDSELYDFIRGAGNADIEQIHQVYPEVFAKRKTMPIARYFHVDYLRTSPNFGPGEKETSRDAKNSGIAGARDAFMGMDPDIEDLRNLDMGNLNALRKEILNKIVEPALQANIPFDVGVERSDGKIEYEFRGKKYIIAASRAHQQRMKMGASAQIEKAMGERSPDEITRMPGRIKLSWPTVRTFKRGPLGKMGLDTKEYKKVIAPMLWDYKNGNLTEANKDALRWMIWQKEGKSFLANSNNFDDNPKVDTELKAILEKAKLDPMLRDSTKGGGGEEPILPEAEMKDLRTYLGMEKDASGAFKPGDMPKAKDVIDNIPTGNLSDLPPEIITQACKILPADVILDKNVLNGLTTKQKETVFNLIKNDPTARAYSEVKEYLEKGPAGTVTGGGKRGKKKK